jgi:hypothetical protein
MYRAAPRKGNSGERRSIPVDVFFFQPVLVFSNEMEEALFSMKMMPQNSSKTLKNGR